MTLQLCQGSLGHSIRLEKKEEVGCERGPRAGKLGRLVRFCESVCGDEEWEEGESKYEAFLQPYACPAEWVEDIMTGARCCFLLSASTFPPSVIALYLENPSWRKLSLLCGSDSL